MAANALTILREWADGKHTQADEVIHALKFAPGGDNFEFGDYCKLVQKERNVQPTAKALLLKYEKLWKELGEPATAEEWAEARHKDNLLKHSTLHAGEYIPGDDISKAA